MRWESVSAAFARASLQSVNESPTRGDDCFVQDIDITSSLEPLVQRLDIANSVLLTFRGLRNANIRDRDTRVSLTLPGPQAARLWRLLGEQLTDAEKTAD
jgi:hypothetical protein